MSEKTYTGYILVKFNGVGKEYSFGTNETHFKIQDKVVVETSRGIELAVVTKGYQEIGLLTHQLELKPVLRSATQRDLKEYKENKVKAFDAKLPLEKCIAKHQLDMKIVSVEYTLDRSKLIVTYVSDNRVDFRELLKEITHLFSSRIELKQIGPRDKAKMVGGLGVCGREMCCKSHLRQFDVISINMAKNQNLSLNTGKLSGQCGKLKCCLRYENDWYAQAKQELPKVNQTCTYNGIDYRVSDVNLVSQQITIQNQNERLVLPFSVLKG